ncbi:MAG TPA: response regulator transcription factor [Rhodanobacteraceae bacterium]|nr:response regulator transcription factor [Rhodanobacteraceae bacterium]
MKLPTRALIVDDLSSSRDWLARALTLAFPGIALASAESLASAWPLCQPAPELALLDLGLPDGSGIDLVRHLSQQSSLCIVATVFDDDAHLFPALRAGAQGYVLKDQSPETLAEMLAGIVSGQPPLSASIARRLLRSFQPVAAPNDSGEEAIDLTPREVEVLRLIAKGLSVLDVARLLELSRHTVAGYLKDIYRKLAVNTRAEATLVAIRHGLVAP